MKTAIAFVLSVALLGGAALAADADTFIVNGTGPDGAYKGTVVLTKLDGGKLDGTVFSVVWSIGGETIEGVGIVKGADGKQLSIAYLHQDRPGVSLMTDNGKEATGIWWTEGLSGSGTETWTKQ